MKLFVSFSVLLAVASFVFVTQGCAHSSCSPGVKYFRYQNPISNGIDPNGVRDCQIFRDGGKWYMVATSWPVWDNNICPNPGVRIYSSDTLTEWKNEGLLIDRKKLAPNVWYLDRFWAPEIHKINGKYYLTFNARNETPQYKTWHGTGVAVSNKLMGPYTILTPNAPFSYGNDITLFQDSDGKVYAYWNGDHVIVGAQVDMAQMKPIVDSNGQPTVAFRSTAGTWDSIGIEGPYVIKRGSTYYMFYSSWTRGYEIGYATSNSPLGPWTKYAGNPIYGSQNREACKASGLPYTGDPNSLFVAVGHNQIFTGYDGRYWLSCHGTTGQGKDMLVIDPIDFDEQGNIKVKKPTYTPQEIRLPDKKSGNVRCD